MRISMIAAVARNAVIGSDNDLPWRLRADMRFFKSTTMGHHIVMGRKTHASMRGRPLPGRTNLVLSRDPAFRAEGVETFTNLDAAFEFAAAAGEQECFVIGGAQIYAAALERADRLYLSVVDAAPEGDAVFPFVDPTAWTVEPLASHAADEDNAHAFRILRLDRR